MTLNISSWLFYVTAVAKVVGLYALERRPGSLSCTDRNELGDQFILAASVKPLKLLGLGVGHVMEAERM